MPFSTSICHIAPMPAAEIPSADFRVTVEGQPVPVYVCRVSAVPLNWEWPGHQRPLEQTEIASFAYFDFSGPIRVQVESLIRPVERVEIRPTAFGIAPAVEGNRIAFTLAEPRHFTVEVNGFHQALHIFTNPLERFDVEEDDPRVRYFGPGVHEPGNIELQSGETVYIAAGAVVYGSISAKHAEHIRVLGHGVLDCSRFPRPVGHEFEGSFSGCICLTGCRDVVIDGIVCRDPNMWTITPNYCDGVTIRNVKLIGLWRYNADGIDVCNSRNVTIRDCFLRTFDDGVVVKGMRWCYKANSYGDAANVENLLVEDCVVWCDWGKALEVGVETCANEMKNITMRRCHVIRTCFTAIDVFCAHNALVSNLLFEDVTVENDDHNVRFVFQTREGERLEDDPDDDFVPGLIHCCVGEWAGDRAGKRGNLRDVVFRNLACRSRLRPGTRLQGWDAAHTIEGVRFENIVYNGERARSAEDLLLQTNAYVSDVEIV